jgi:GNAT superfamily N-acetyltransferase
VKGFKQIVIEEPTSVQQLLVTKTLLDEYWSSLGFSRATLGFGNEVDNLPGEYSRPSGRLAMAMSFGEACGCIALRRFNRRSCEMKRLFVRDAARGRGIAATLLNWLIAKAQSEGYVTMLADTLPTMAAVSGSTRGSDSSVSMPIPPRRLLEQFTCK